MPIPRRWRKILRDSGHPDQPAVRLRCGLLAGCVGIAVNTLLFVVKLGISFFTGSIAIAADAVNNLSDAAASSITVVGFKLADRPADQEHPFGHGRLEYVAGLIVSVLILATGFNFLKEAIIRIWKPTAICADPLSLAILSGTILLKFGLFRFYRRIGKLIDSQVILAASFDSLSDILATAAVLAAVFFAGKTAFPIDGCAGAAVAILIVIGGFKILKETSSPLLGEKPDPQLVDRLKQSLLDIPGINGVHDVILHNYGPNRYFATAHAEIENSFSFSDIHNLLEYAEAEISRKLPVQLLLHCDPYDAHNPRFKLWLDRLESAALALDHRMRLYGFRLEGSKEEPILHFHLLVPRRIRLSDPEIERRLTEILCGYQQNIHLRIVFLHTML